MKLASIEKIKEVKQLPKSDFLDLVYVLGFQCVTQRGLYKEGDIICYIQPDSLLPIENWTEGYRKYSPDRIRAVKLRNYWSEGIIVPLDMLSDIIFCHSELEKCVGQEISDMIGVTKWEAPIPFEKDAERQSPLKQTNEDRFENIQDQIPFGELCDVTLKVDGKSFTATKFLKEDSIRVSGRLLEYKKDSDNNHIRLADYYQLEDKLKALSLKYNTSISLRGELNGIGLSPGGFNPHNQKEKNVLFFSVFLPDQREYANKGHELYFLNVCKELNLESVPVLEENVLLTPELLTKYSIDLKTINGHNFEGVVIKHAKGSFKVINKHYDSLK